MRKWIILAVILLLGAGAALLATQNDQEKPEPPRPPIYQHLEATDAQAKMTELTENGTDFILLDVRTEAEFEEAHLPGATLLPLDDLAVKAPVRLPDQDAYIFVYCRSGYRSEQAALSLVGGGYRNVFDIGGIIDWPFEIVGELRGED
ncbi:rhodanese-like domain-containing protein [Candidatus Saccharibacteria bacterium]|nr:rhodanese-like domain-containing protein [Candidatus Saccharibacteria bacterium]